MAFQQQCYYLATSRTPRVFVAQSSSGGKDNGSGFTSSTSPAQQLSPLASTFQRRLFLGVGSASVVAIGANFCGITSFLLGLSPDAATSLKLDVIYPLRGYFRYIQPDDGFEFIYPEAWVAGQTVFFRAAEKAELERSLDPPPLSSRSRRKRNVNEPVIAFGPPGSTGELNVSVIVSPVPLDFRIEAFGTPQEVGESVIRSITGSSRGPDVKAFLLRSDLREDSIKKVNYYELEFKVESPSFQRHNVAVCCAQKGRLYTLNAQAPESMWDNVKQDFYKIATSFSLTS